VFWLLFKIDLCSAISFESSRRELSIDVAEHGCILLNMGNAYYPVLVSHPKQVYQSPKRVFCFYCEQLRMCLNGYR